MKLSTLSLGIPSRTEEEIHQEQTEMYKSLLTCSIPYDESAIKVTKELSIFHRKISIIASSGEKDDGIQIYEGLDFDEIQRFYSVGAAIEGYGCDVDMNMLNELLLEQSLKILHKSYSLMLLII